VHGLFSFYLFIWINKYLQIFRFSPLTERLMATFSNSGNNETHQHITLWRRQVPTGRDR